MANGSGEEHHAAGPPLDLIDNVRDDAGRFAPMANESALYVVRVGLAIGQQVDTGGVIGPVIGVYLPKETR